MYSTVQPNEYQAKVSVRRNTTQPDLVALGITEGNDVNCFSLVLTEPAWQAVVDQLARLGIVAQPVPA